MLMSQFIQQAFSNHLGSPLWQVLCQVLGTREEPAVSLFCELSFVWQGTSPRQYSECCHRVMNLWVGGTKRSFQYFLTLHPESASVSCMLTTALILFFLSCFHPSLWMCHRASLLGYNLGLSQFWFSSPPVLSKSIWTWLFWNDFNCYDGMATSLCRIILPQFFQHCTLLIFWKADFKTVDLSVSPKW